MIGVAGYVSGVAVLDLARRVCEAVPDGFGFAVFVPRAFDLVGSGRGSPEESFRENNCGWNFEPVRRRAPRHSLACFRRFAATREESWKRDRASGAERGLQELTA